MQSAKKTGKRLNRVGVFSLNSSKKKGNTGNKPQKIKGIDVSNYKFR
jgi:hypothetical protein